MELAAAMLANSFFARRPTPLAMLVPQADQVWINYLNHWIELKKARGYFKQAAAKWQLATD